MSKNQCLSHILFEPSRKGTKGGRGGSEAKHREIKEDSINHVPPPQMLLKSLRTTLNGPVSAASARRFETLQAYREVQTTGQRAELPARCLQERRNAALARGLDNQLCTQPCIWLFTQPPARSALGTSSNTEKPSRKENRGRSSTKIQPRMEQ